MDQTYEFAASLLIVRQAASYLFKIGGIGGPLSSGEASSS